MPRFFVTRDQITDGIVTIINDDAHHLSRSLRMAVGETITVCDEDGMEYTCKLDEFLSDRVLARVLQSRPSTSEPPFSAHVFQALPKGEKLDQVIQKAVECGAAELTTFESERCIVRIKGESEDKKVERRRRIALEAAKQSGRAMVPLINSTVSFEEAVKKAVLCDLALFCYEDEKTVSLPAVLESFHNRHFDVRPTIALMVGSEGGFSKKEALAAQEMGMVPVSLGPRILRTETAASFALSCLIYELELKKC